MTIVEMIGTVTIAAMTATGTTAIVVMNAMGGMIGIVVTIATRAMTVVGMIEHLTLVNAQGRLLAGLTQMIVAPGRPLPRGMMIGGLQGTMIDEDHMIYGEVLTLILIAAGTNVGVTTRTNATMTGHPEPTGIMVGDAE